MVSSIRDSVLKQENIIALVKSMPTPSTTAEWIAWSSRISTASKTDDGIPPGPAQGLLYQNWLNDLNKRIVEFGNRIKKGQFNLILGDAAVTAAGATYGFLEGYDWFGPVDIALGLIDHAQTGTGFWENALGGKTRKKALSNLSIKLLGEDITKRDNFVGAETIVGVPVAFAQTVTGFEALRNFNWKDFWASLSKATKAAEQAGSVGNPLQGLVSMVQGAGTLSQQVSSVGVLLGAANTLAKPIAQVIAAAKAIVARIGLSKVLVGTLQIAAVVSAATFLFTTFSNGSAPNPNNSQGPFPVPTVVIPPNDKLTQLGTGKATHDKLLADDPTVRSAPEVGKPVDAFGHVMQNKNVKALQDAGYNVINEPTKEQLKYVGYTKDYNPDYIIEGKMFDHWAPNPKARPDYVPGEIITTDEVFKSMWSTFTGKVPRQTTRIVLDIGETPMVTAADVAKYWDANAQYLPELEEIIIINDGKIIGQWTPPQ